MICKIFTCEKANFSESKGVYSGGFHAVSAGYNLVLMFNYPILTWPHSQYTSSLRDTYTYSGYVPLSSACLALSYLDAPLSASWMWQR